MIFDGFGGSLIERDGNIPFLRFTPEAQECFDPWRGRLENQIRSGKEHPVLEAHLSKYRSLLPSLALLFHLIEMADGLSSGPVSKGAIVRAFGWVEFLEAHARRIYQSVTQYKLVAARLLADKIKANQLPNPFTLRDVYHKGWSGLSEVNDVSSAVGLLEDSYWLRSQEIRTLGRPKTLYLINPRLKPSKAPKAA